MDHDCSRRALKMETKKLYRFSLWITCFLSIVTGILWINNLVSALRYHYSLFTFSGDGKEVENFSAQGLFSFLDWTTVDASTVTTLIPFMGFLLIWNGLLHVRTGDEWPFFPGYDRLNIALGLLGTVWGIILVGYYPSETISIQALMHCLHTAMFSTLAAVAWVMVIIPALIRPWLQTIRKGLGVQDDDSSLSEMVEGFTGKVRLAGDAMQKTAADSVQFRECLGQINNVFAEMLKQMSQGRDAERQFRQEAVSGISAISDTIRELAGHLEHLEECNKSLLKKKEELQEQAIQIREEKAHLQNDYKHLSDDNAKLQFQHTELNEKYEQLDKDNEKLQRQHEDLNQKYEQLDKDDSKLKQQHEELNKKYEQLDKDNEKLQQQHEDLNQKYEQLDKDKAELLDKSKSLQADLTKLQTVKEDLSAQLESMKKQNTTLSDELAESGNEVKKLQKQLASIHSILKNIE